MRIVKTMLPNVLYFAVILATDMIVHVSTCPFSMTCPCGSSGKNYTRCVDPALLKQYSCSRWSYCQTCESTSEFCVTCPSGHFGPTCRDDEEEFNKKKEEMSSDLCPPIREPPYGSLRCFTKGGIRSCTARCSPGYRFRDSTAEEITVECHKNFWEPGRYFPRCDQIQSDGQPLKMQETTCHDPGIPKNGGRIDLKGAYITTLRPFTVGEVVIFYCNDGYTTIVRGSVIVICTADGSWSSRRPKCAMPQKVEESFQSKTTCKHPGVVENGIIEDFQSKPEQFPVGIRLTFMCRDGYEIQGPKAISCLRNASWSDDVPVCKKINERSCKHPGTVENGMIEDESPKIQSFPLGSTLKFQCKEGYKMEGPKAIYCIRSKSKFADWSGVPPFCRQISTKPEFHPDLKTSCEHPGVVNDATISVYPAETKRFLAGTSVLFSCREGYELEGQQMLYCRRTGQWSADLPTCIATTAEESVLNEFCEYPGAIEDGMYIGIESGTEGFPVNTSLTIQCRAGTERDGPEAIYCLSTGQWSAAPPTCKAASIKTDTSAPEMFCQYPGPIENGEIDGNVIQTEQFPVGSSLKFKCKEGYIMTGLDSLNCLDTGLWTSDTPQCIRPQTETDCGRSPQNLSRNGKHSRSDWPWTVGISTASDDNVDKMFCGGALLNKRTVITAAHCVTGPLNLKLHFGARRQDDPESGASQSEQVRNISRIIIHPEYDYETHANDVAMLMFEGDMYYGLTIQPVCLPAPNSSAAKLPPEATVVVTGYGLTFTDYSTADFKATAVPLQPDETCNAVCKDQGLVSCSPSTFCAGHSQNSTECIYGGSPAVILNDSTNRHVLEGLVTRSESARNGWNGKCKRPERFTMLTNVTHFLPFILENLI